MPHNEHEGTIAARVTHRLDGQPDCDASGLTSAQVALSCLIVSCALTGPVFAQEPAVQDKGAAPILNPLTNTTQVLITPSVAFPEPPGSQAQSSINFQPRLPFPITSDWRIVTRSNVTVLHTPAADRPMALGDIDASSFIAPARTIKWLWGAGPRIQVPTATNASDGTGKWSGGPAGGLIYADGPWVNGVIVSQLRSFAGPRSREDVNLTEIETQVSYTFSNDWYLVSAPTFIHDWQAAGGQRWTVPLGIEVGRSFKVCSQNVSAQVGAYYNMKKPAAMLAGISAPNSGGSTDGRAPSTVLRHGTGPSVRRWRSASDEARKPLVFVRSASRRARVAPS